MITPPRFPATALAALGFAAFALFTSGLRAESAAPAVAGASASVASAGEELPLPVISAAPAWTLTDLDGKPIGAETLKGKIVVVDFWATWCGPCIHEIPGYIELQKKYGERGLVIVGVSLDQKGEAAVRPFAKRKAINYPLALATPEVIKAFGGIEVIPTTVLIDREGRIRHRKTGAMETGDYEKLIVTLL